MRKINAWSIMGEMRNCCSFGQKKAGSKNQGSGSIEADNFLIS
jgi:hypothetical protein